MGAPSPPPLSSAAKKVRGPYASRKRSDRGATVVTHCCGRPLGNGAVDSAPDSCASLAPQDESTLGRRLVVPPKSSTASALSTHVSSDTISRYALASSVRNGSFSSSCRDTCAPSTQGSGGGAGGHGGGGGGGGGRGLRGSVQVICSSSDGGSSATANEKEVEPSTPMLGLLPSRKRTLFDQRGRLAESADVAPHTWATFIATAVPVNSSSTMPPARQN